MTTMFAGTVSYPVTLLVGPPNEGASLNIIRYVELESIRIEDSGNQDIDTLEFEVVDKDLTLTGIVNEGKVILRHRNHELFRGYIKTRRPSIEAASRRWFITCHSVSSMLDKCIIPPGAASLRKKAESDKARIQWLLSTFGQPFLRDGSSDFSKIQVLDGSLPRQRFGGLTLRQGIERVLGAASDSANYYCDGSGRVHTFDDDHPESDTAPYEIKVAHTLGSHEAAPQDLAIDWDSTDLINYYYVRGSDATGSGAFSDAASIAAYGRRQAFVDAPDADTPAKAKRVGRAALRDTRYPVVRGTFSLERPYDERAGVIWRAGQLVRVTSGQHGLLREPFRILRVTTTYLSGAGDRHVDIEFGALRNRHVAGVSASGGLYGASPLTTVASGLVGLAGADQFLRLSSADGSGLLTTNTDPAITGYDGVTGEPAFPGSDIGFGWPMVDFINSGVYNAQFFARPPNTDAPISDDNPLPFWRFGRIAGGIEAYWVPDIESPSGGAIQWRVPADSAVGDESYIEQIVPINGSEQVVAIRRDLGPASGTANVVTRLRYQFLSHDGTPIGSEAYEDRGPWVSSVDSSTLPIEPDPTARYLRVRIGARASIFVSVDVSRNLRYVAARPRLTYTTLTCSISEIPATGTGTLPVVTNAAGGSGRFIADRPGWVHGLSVRANGSRVTGTATFRVREETIGWNSDLSVSLGASAGQENWASQPIYTAGNRFARGDILRGIVTITGTWSSSPAGAGATLVVRLAHYDDL